MVKYSLSPNTKIAQKDICIILSVSEEGILTKTGSLIDKSTKGQLSKLIKSSRFGKFGQNLPLFDFYGHPQLLLVGTGQVKKITRVKFRELCISCCKSLNQFGFKKAVNYLNELLIEDTNEYWKTKQFIEAAHEACYRFDKFKTGKTTNTSLQEIIVTYADKSAAEKGLKEGLAVSKGIDLMKNLSNQPSNVCTPTFLAEQARQLARDYKSISVAILDEKKMRKIGMGAVLNVAKGSAEPPQFICIEHGSKTKKKPIVLIGKGVTFDTGGISLKPPDSMVGMKYDMCGAATVLGTIKAVAELNLSQRVIGIIPAVENMPGGKAYKPEDIVTSLSGQTIEIISTDAEGRLILADALTYAERYDPEAVIDIATLTGAVVIALGFHATGLLANDDPLADALLNAGTVSNDRAWRLPLWDEYDAQIESPFADMANVGGRPAGTITAASFLSRFAKKFKWAHLDVAGTAAMMMGTSERKATGRPVPMLVQYLLDRSKEKQK